MLRAVATTSLSFSLILNKLPAVEKKTMKLGVTNLTFEGKMGDFEKYPARYMFLYKKKIKKPTTDENFNACYVRRKNIMQRHV